LLGVVTVAVLAIILGIFMQWVSQPLATGLMASGSDRQLWRDDFISKELDEASWHRGPPFPPGMNLEEAEAVGATVAPGSGAVFVAGAGVRLRHLLWAPFRLRAKLIKPEVDGDAVEHVVTLVPFNGGLALHPGWRCDPDPYLSMPRQQAAALLAAWPGGMECFWNCSVKPVERAIELSVDEEGLVSLADDGGCKTARFSWIAQPVRVLLGCRLRLSEPSKTSTFPYADSDASIQFCPDTAAAQFGWFEVSARKVEVDPGLPKGNNVSSSMLLPGWLHRLLESRPSDFVPLPLRQLLIAVGLAI